MNTIFEDNYLLAIETLKSQSKKHTAKIGLNRTPMSE